MTLLNKLKLTAVAVLFNLLSVGGVGPWQARESSAAPVPKAKDAGLLWVLDPDAAKLVALTPDGDEVKAVKLADKNFDPIHFLGIAPNGEYALFVGSNGAWTDQTEHGLIIPTVHLLPLHEPGKLTDTGIGYVSADTRVARMADTVCASADGEHVYRCRDATKPGTDRGTWAVTRFDRTGKNPKEITLPDHTWLNAVLPGGDFLLEEYVSGRERRTHLYHWTPGGEKPVKISGEVNVCAPAVSPDGKTLLATAQHLKSTAPPDGEFQKLVSIDPATGKDTTVLHRDKTGGVRGWWSPDGRRIAVLWHEWDDAKPKPLDGGLRSRRSGVGEVSVRNPDGSGEKVILKLDDPGEDHPGATDPRLRKRLLGWFPKAKPPVKEPIKAPVPKEKVESMGLTAKVSPEKDVIVLGEPTWFTFTVTNPTTKAWSFAVGGDYRNRLGRPNSFKVDVTDTDGKAVPQPDPGPDMGGLSGGVKLPADGSHTFTLFLPHWATFDKPGEYTVVVRRKLTLVPLDPVERETAKPETAVVVAAGKITVAKADAKKLGDVIATLGVELLTPQPERATKMLLEIRDERVIPHFVRLSKLGRVEARYAACTGLKRFKTDEAFAALKAMAATTADDLKGTAVNRRLEESSARAVRHSSISALADCPHPDALPLVWKAADDENDAVRLTVLHKAFEVKSPEARKIIEALTADPDERVRDEAKRYAGLLAKEKK